MKASRLARAARTCWVARYCSWVTVKPRATRSSARWPATQATPSRSGNWLVSRRSALRAVLLALIAMACTPRGVSNPVPPSLPITPWAPRAAGRGINLSPKTPLGVADYAALDLLMPGAVAVFSAQLGDGDPLPWIGNDPQLQRWLSTHRAATQLV